MPKYKGRKFTEQHRLAILSAVHNRLDENSAIDVKSLCTIIGCNFNVSVRYFIVSCIRKMRKSGCKIAYSNKGFWLSSNPNDFLNEYKRLRFDIDRALSGMEDLRNLFPNVDLEELFKEKESGVQGL